MLSSLTYNVTFAKTDRTLQGKVEFQKGFGSITGPNESGKSMILELVRYALWGTGALRGELKDYAKLAVTLTWTVSGKSYSVERSLSGAKVYKGQEELAVGTKAVNLKIVEIMGFGMDVFDTACIANQGDIEKLGQMRPADRKRMVDNVIGLKVIEDIGKWAKDEASGLRKEANVLAETLVPAIIPAKPNGYAPPAVLKDEIDRLTLLRSELDQINGWLSHDKPEPKLPKSAVDMPSDALKMLMVDQIEQEAAHRALQAEYSNLPKPSPYSDQDLDAIEAQWEAWDAWSAYNQHQKQYPGSTHSRDKLLSYLEQHQINDLIGERIEYERLLAKINHVNCPNCDHEFSLSPDYEAKLREDIARLNSDIGDRTYIEPPLDEDEIEREIHKINAREQNPGPDPVPEVTRPSISRRDIETYRTANRKAARRQELKAQIDAYQKPEHDFKAMYDKAVAYEQALASYHQDMESYNQWLAEKSEKIMRQVELMDAVKLLPDLQESYAASLAYEQQYKDYQLRFSIYTKTVEKIEAKEVEVAEWTKVAEAMTALRSLVKQHLLPSLNKTASHLLAQMTGGQRQKVVVDEEFEVLVDGQPLGTLSGSGKAVANLALRIALGQVLTNNVFSVFMGDEIDASLDADRAEATAETLRNLKKSISQVVVVSHKRPDADYVIELGA